MKKILFVVCLLLVLFATNALVNADEIVLPNDGIYTGLEIMSEEEMEAFHNTLPRIVDVKPNSIALSRLSEEESVLFENIDVAEIGEETVYAAPGDETMLMSTTEFPLTDAVDVSDALTFPPIGDQGQTNSCMEWALCYYMLTNNHNVVNNLQAKEINNGVVVAIEENIISPGFIFSLINGGEDKSENYEYVCNTIMTHGSPNADVYDLEITDESLKKWCTDTNVWYDAIYNKPEKISYSIINTNDGDSVAENIITIKELLSNGYVISISTFVRSFEYTTVTTTGEYACRYMKNDMQGAHAMTIVGYDDQFGIDVNGDGEIRDDELGAFKIVNSWGTIEHEKNPYKNGYVWMSYDAFFDESIFANMPSERQGVARFWYYIEAQKNYSPLLVAEIEIAAAQRNYISLSFRLSQINENVLSQEFPVPENGKNSTFFGEYLVHNCLDVNFSGGSEIETAVFPFDLTHIIKSVYGDHGIPANTNMRFDVMLYDEKCYDDTIMELKRVSIVEVPTEKRNNCIDETVMTVGEDGAYKWIDFTMDTFVAHGNQQTITLEFKSNVCLESVNENIYLLTPDMEIIYPITDVEDNKIIVLSPSNGYELDAEYELIITSNVASAGKNRLQENFQMPIYVLGENHYFTIVE